MTQTEQTVSQSGWRVMTYYFVLLGGLLLLSRPNAYYSEAFRVIFMSLIYLPLINNPRFTPFAIIVFYGFCEFACYSILPENKLFCISPLLLILLLNKDSVDLKFARDNGMYVLLYVYCLFVSLICLDFNQRFIYFALFSLLLYPFIRDEEDVKNMALGFCLMSAALSLNYLMNFSYYIVANRTEIGGMDYGVWGNRNVLSGAISSSIPIAFGLILKFIKVDLSKGTRLLVFAGVFLSIFAVISLASRGSIVASTLSVFGLLFCAEDIKFFKKIVYVFILTGCVAALYFLGFLDIMLYRFFELGTTETAGGRVEIWSYKFNVWSDSNIFNMLFGIGKTGCENLGYFRSTHNDFLTALMAFGIIGFSLFLGFLIYPLQKASCTGRKYVICVLIYLIAECMVLEPFFRGNVTFWALYVFLVRYVAITRQNELK